MSDIVLFQPVRAWDRNGVFAPGATATFYEPGTSTPRTVYSDEALTTAHASPLVADARGVFPAVYTTGSVRVVVKDEDGVTLPGGDMDPAPVTASSGTAASGVTFTATAEIPETDVQAAIERVQANAEGVAEDVGFGLSASGAPLLLNFDVTTIASGAYRFDATTTGTRPTGWSGTETGVAIFLRETATAGALVASDPSDGIIWVRPITASSWGAWQRVTPRTFNQADWTAGTDTNDAAISPAKLSATIDAKRTVYQVEDRKASGTAGGGSTGSTWVTRDLQTEAIADVSGASLASNVVTLPAGRYRVTGYAPAYRIGGHRIRLYDVTNAAALLLGSTAHSAASADTSPILAHLEGEITLAAETDVRLEHWTANTRATDGFGLAATSGDNEIYSVLRFERLGA